MREMRAGGLAGEQIRRWQTFAVGRGFHGLDLPGGESLAKLVDNELMRAVKAGHIDAG